MKICLTVQAKHGTDSFQRIIEVDSKEDFLRKLKHFEEDVPFEFDWTEREPDDVRDFPLFDTWDEDFMSIEGLKRKK